MHTTAHTHTSRSQRNQHHREKSEVVGDMDTDGAVVDSNVQQGNEEERDEEHDVAESDPSVAGEVVDCAHVEGGGEESREEVDQRDNFGHMGEVFPVEIVLEIVYCSDVAVEWKQKSSPS